MKDFTQYLLVVNYDLGIDLIDMLELGGNEKFQMQRISD